MPSALQNRSKGTTLSAEKVTLKQYDHTLLEADTFCPPLALVNEIIRVSFGKLKP